MKVEIKTTVDTDQIISDLVKAAEDENTIQKHVDAIKRAVAVIVSLTEDCEDVGGNDSDSYVTRAPKLFWLCREYRKDIKAKQSGKYYVDILADIFQEMKEKIKAKEEENRNLKEELEEVSPDCYREYDESNFLCADCPIVKRCRKQKIIKEDQTE